MAIPIPSDNESNFAPVPAGTYPGRCFKMIHIGTIQETIKGEDKILNKIMVFWELPTKQKEFKGGQGMKPFVVNEEYNISMNENSNFRKMLESWKAATFDSKTMKEFDITSMLGVPCMLSVKHNTAANGKVYANVSSVSPVMEGYETPKQINETFLLDYDNFTLEKFNPLPQFIRDKMVKSIEYTAMVNNENNNQEYYNAQEPK